MWRADADLTLDQLVALVNDQLAPPDRISRRTVSRYEEDDFPPEAARPVVLAAIATVCGHKTRELSDTVQEGILKSATVIERSRWTAQGSQRVA